MKHLRIGICMKDADFAGAFLLMAEKQHPGSCRLSFFERDFGENISLLLTDCESMWQQKRKAGLPSLLLTEESPQGDPTKIYKYAGATEILARILYLCGVESRFSMSETVMKTIGVMSSSGGTGCTLLAHHLAQILQSEREQRVFFLSLDTFEDVAFSATDENSFGAREYLYYLESKKQVPVESFLVSDAHGIVSFRRSMGKNPLADLAPEMLRQVVSELAVTGMFDVLVADVGSGLSESRIAMMDLMEETVFVSGKHDERYRKYLEDVSATDKEPYCVRIKPEITEDPSPKALELAQQTLENLLI